MQARLLFASKDKTDQLQRLFTYLHIPLELKGEKWLTMYIKIAPFFTCYQSVHYSSYLLYSGTVFGLRLNSVIIAMLNLLIISSRGGVYS